MNRPYLLQLLALGLQLFDASLVQPAGHLRVFSSRRVRRVEVLFGALSADASRDQLALHRGDLLLQQPLLLSLLEKLAAAGFQGRDSRNLVALGLVLFSLELE